jgi:hypothetical protein
MGGEYDLTLRKVQGQKEQILEIFLRCWMSYRGVEWIDAEVVEVHGPIPAAWRNAVCPMCFDTAA